MKKANLIVAACFLIWGALQAQEKTTVVEKRQSSVQLSFFKKADNTKVAVVKVTAKEANGKFMPAMNAPVNIYAQNDKEQVLVGNALTALDGKATVELPKTLPLDADMKFTITAKIENDKVFDDAEDKGTFKEANLSLTLDPSDTSRTITVKATEMGKDGKEKPIADGSINFYVQRRFGTMPAAEDHSVSTDAAGEATFSLPSDIKGDTAGMVTVVARIDDNETYGTVETKSEARFGIPLQPELDPFPRALWEPRAPTPLVITICVIFTCIWGIYFFIFFTMIRISRTKTAVTTGKPPLELTYESHLLSAKYQKHN